MPFCPSLCGWAARPAAWPGDVPRAGPGATQGSRGSLACACRMRVGTAHLRPHIVISAMKALSVHLCDTCTDSSANIRRQAVLLPQYSPCAHPSHLVPSPLATQCRCPCNRCKHQDPMQAGRQGHESGLPPQIAGRMVDTSINVRGRNLVVIVANGEHESASTGRAYLLQYLQAHQCLTQHGQDQGESRERPSQ